MNYIELEFSQLAILTISNPCNSWFSFSTIWEKHICPKSFNISELRGLANVIIFRKEIIGTEIIGC